MNVPPVISEAFYHGIQWLRTRGVDYHNLEEAQRALEKWFALPYVQDHFKMLIQPFGRLVTTSGSVVGSGAVASTTHTVTRTDNRWRCSDGSCPEREPILSFSQPICYTCNRPMSEVKGV